MVGVPVIINHKDLNKDNADDERVGVVNSVWYDDKDGWYWCDGIIWNETAQNLITDKNWSVSCSYDVKTANDEGGSENNIKYDMEFLDGVFTHLALVNNPRYERANIVFNSKTEIINKENEEMNVENDKWITKYDKEGEPYHVNIDDTEDKKEDFEKGTKSTKKDEDRHQKVKDLEDKAYKEFKTMYDNYIDKDGMEGWGGIPASRFDKAKEQFNKKYKDAFDKLESDRFVSFEDFAKRENKQSDTKDKQSESKGGKKENYQEIIDKYDKKYNVDKNDKDESWYDRASKSEIKTDLKQHEDLLKYNEQEIERVSKIVSGEFLDGKYKNDEHFKNLLKSLKERLDWHKEHIEYAKAHLEKKQNKANNNKEQEMALLDELKKLITKVENGKESDMEKIENEKVDKRKLIDEVGGILKGKVDDEIIRTIIGKLEKVAYDKSEADTADNKKEDEKAENCDKKVKNEEEKDEKEVKEIKEEVKEDVENKCKNSVDNSKTDYFAKLNEIYNSAAQAKQEPSYVSREDREKAAEEYFAK